VADMNNPVLDARQIVSGLGEATIWRDVRTVASTGSTNIDVAALARDGAPEGLVVVASEQTAGRGRLDRTWASPPGASVAMSLLLQPQPSWERWGWLSLLAGMAVAGGVGDPAPQGGGAGIQRPNDVLIRGRKVCGILSERVEHPTGPRAVVGIGINLTLTEDELPVPTATSLALEGFPSDGEAVVTGVLSHFERHYATWQRNGTLHDAYAAQCASVGAELSITVDKDHRIHGRGYGVDDLGRLQVSTPTGMQTFAVGDVVHARLRRD